jgi:hypothetical protein
MFTKKSVFLMFPVLLAVLMMTSTASARPLYAALGTGFTYQGRLTDGGAPANGTYDLQFKLYDALSGGNQVGSTVTLGDVTVTAGLFTVQLDFGNVFDGTALYLQIGVRPGTSTGAYTTLTPRQLLSATPYALYTTQAGNADLLDNQHGSYYQNAGNINAGTLGNSFFDAYANLVAKGYLGNAAGDLALNNGTLQATLNADLLDGLHAASFTLSGHNHWGESWTGSGSGLTLGGGTTGLSGSGSTYGVFGQTDSTGGYGVYGISSATSGAAYGVYGRSQSTSGYAVWGSSVALTGNTIGVVGATNSSSGTGVFGYNTNTGGVTYGVSGQSYSNTGRGVYGWASATSGTTYGVYGQSDSNAGTGVYGTGGSYGVYGSGMTGVYGIGANTGVYGSGINGVYGQSDSTGGTGVWGYVSATSGTTYGMWGQSDSTAGTGVRGYASATSGTTYGVYGKSYSTNGGAGVYGTGFTGVLGQSHSGTGNGVWGTSISGNGVYGTGNTGVYGVGNTGVSGSGSDTGVYGYATSSGGTGIEGVAYENSGNYAGYFQGNVEVHGAFTVYGGPKSAAVDTKDYGTRLLYAVESPENWFQDFGTGQLTNGAAVISINPVYAETVNLTEDYHVFLTPNGDCALYVENKTPTSFSVRALGGQTCSIAFDYNIVAKRLGYEDIRLAVTNPPPAVETPNK